MSEILITPEGYERLKHELEELKTVKRREIVERIRAARALGDLSENFDYQDAKRQQAFLEGRIKDLETVLSRAKVVPRPDNAAESVHLGSVVTLQDMETGKERTIKIVGSFEADPLQDLISILSPLGESLLGKATNEEVVVNTPKGEVRYRIVRIE
ncbi:MAG: transcription elongation factor GreA [Fimbriimonadales bacterium]|nr:MAG: transcription elongation factor GreA [Fimbriimonadales bacterium]GIV10555.1 MAG: transcription elongation factor GreA [Fimbriimonadales bacterium]